MPPVLSCEASITDATILPVPLIHASYSRTSMRECRPIAKDRLNIPGRPRTMRECRPIAKDRLNIPGRPRTTSRHTSPILPSPIFRRRGSGRECDQSKGATFTRRVPRSPLHHCRRRVKGAMVNVAPMRSSQPFGATVVMTKNPPASPGLALPTPIQQQYQHDARSMRRCHEGPLGGRRPRRRFWVPGPTPLLFRLERLYRDILRGKRG
jgi:hypothetical protein